MCAVTGKYEDELGRDEEIKEEASEIIHIKQGTETYGIPRWVGLASVVLGVSQADFVNYDLFQSSGIPALAILVSGGRLTSESWEDIANILDGMKGVENWNKIAILEALGVDDTGEVDDKPTNAKVDFKELPRPSDAEFQNYVKQGEKRIQSCFKLPPLLSGEAEEYSRSCYSEDTQTLTENGWKYYWEIEEGEKIATFNPETNEMQYHLPVGNILLHHYEGKMVEFKNRNNDICVTPDHTMWAQPSYSHCPFRKFEAKDFLDEKIGKRYFKHAPDSIEKKENLDLFPIPVEQRKDTLIPKEFDYKLIKGDEFVEFLGLFIGDGSTYTRKNQYNIALGAHKERKKEKFKEYGELFKNSYSMNVSYSEDKKTGKLTVFISDKGLRNWLRENCGENAKNKKIPDEFMNLNQRQSKILLDALIFTDGTRSKKENEKNFSLSTTSKILADQAQILGIKCGYRVGVAYQESRYENHSDLYRVSFVEKNWSLVHKSQIREIDYNGMVYCFEVPNHLFFTRRNGKVAIQGNTSDSSKLVAESEVFSPERKEFDEVINFTIMKSLDAKYHRFESLGPQLMQAETQIDALGKLARAGALTVNDGVRIANRVLDLDKPLFDSEWSQIPVALLLELIKKERVTEIENVGMTPEQAEVLGKAEKALESDEIKKDIDQLGDNVDGIVDQLDQLYSLLMRTD
jgi:hypothetical protein